MDEHSIKRFWAKVEVRGPNECWPWTAGVNNKGYGWFAYRLTTGKMSLAHRVSYFLAHGVIPRVCRHTCDNPLCVNPAHLLDGTQKDNCRDTAVRERVGNQNIAKTHCIRGHPFSVENTWMRENNFSTVTGARLPERVCRTCQQDRHRQFKARRGLRKLRTLGQ